MPKGRSRKNPENTNIIYKIVGRNIKEIREKAGFSIADAAEKLHVVPSYIWLLENGKRRITLDLLEDMARLYGVNIEDFLREDERLNETAIKDKQLNNLLKEWEKDKENAIVLLREFRKLSSKQLNSVINTVKTLTPEKKEKGGDDAEKDTGEND